MYTDIKRFFLKLSLALLFLLIVTSIILIILRFPHTNKVEIILPQKNSIGYSIYIDGDVANPGYFNLRPDSTLLNVLESSGAIANSYSDLNNLKLTVTHINAAHISAQKVDLNRAEPWLLEALPGIGEILAKRIVEYRHTHGGFRNTSELLQVDGISLSTYERIKDKITVMD